MRKIHYLDIKDIIGAEGLRIVLVKGFPSPWGQAAKAMMEYKDLDYLVGPQLAGQANPELVEWAGTNSGPVVAWNDEPPLNRWNDILLLLERLAPEKSLVPDDPNTRIRFFGLAHEICGELGFGWNRRLEGVHKGVEAGREPGEFGMKYGYNRIDGEKAATRAIAFMQHLAGLLAAQAAAGRPFILGETLTAIDFYWAAFSNLVAIQTPEECPLDPKIRPRFEQVSPEVAAAVSPILIEHRDRIMRDYFKIPMEL